MEQWKKFATCYFGNLVLREKQYQQKVGSGKFACITEKRNALEIMSIVF